MLGSPLSYHLTNLLYSGDDEFVFDYLSQPNQILQISKGFLLDVLLVHDINDQCICHSLVHSANSLLVSSTSPLGIENRCIQ